jgi:hypothetical protein
MPKGRLLEKGKELLLLGEYTAEGRKPLETAGGGVMVWELRCDGIQ